MQAVRERLTVAVRARSVSNPDHIQIRPASSTVRVVLPPELASARSDNQRSSWEWTYDHVFGGESSQEKIFDETVAPVVDAVLRGYNGTVLCFGQTGSGKTYTHTGSTSQFAQRGVAPRAIARVFSHAARQPQYETLVTASYLEIYNDTLVDLLTELPGPGPESLSLVDCESSTTVRGLRAVAVADEAAALEVLFTGERRRSVSCHQLNDRSSRGHAVFTLSMEFRSRVESSGRVTRAKLVFVDLAGSERLKKTQTSGCLRGESVYINQSLTHLDQVVVAAAVSRGHVPYRRSKLTHLLRDAIGGNSKTLLIANMSGQAAHLEETIATLEFAARARAVVNSATVVEELGPAALLQKYQRTKKVIENIRHAAMKAHLDAGPGEEHGGRDRNGDGDPEQPGRSGIHQPAADDDPGDVGHEVLGLLDDLVAQHPGIVVEALVEHPGLVEVEVLAVLAEDALHDLVAHAEGEVGLDVVDQRLADVVGRPVEEEPHEEDDALPAGLRDARARLERHVWQRHDLGVPDPPAALGHHQHQHPDDVR